MKNNFKQKFCKPRLLIIGCGDIGMRLLPLVRERFRVFAVTTQLARGSQLRAAGAIPIFADLDRPASLAPLAGLAKIIVHLAPPQPDGMFDKRTRSLTAILPEQATLVYISTTGVYGDCGQEPFDETRMTNAQNPRAKRRVDAEKTLRAWARRSHARLVILRVPGIYAGDRLPLERLQNAAPALLPQEDVYTNHIHADDLARIIQIALFRAAPCRVYHAVDDSDLKMGDYFDLVADSCGLPRPPRLARKELQSRVSPAMLSFMSESRRLKNQRIKCELGVRLLYPQVRTALRRKQDGLKV